MNKNIKSDLFLKLDAVCDLALYETLILILGDIALSEFLSVLLYIRSLREGTDCCCGEYGKSEKFLLDLFSFIECGKSCVIGILDRSNPVSDSLVITSFSVPEEFSVHTIALGGLNIVFAFDSCKFCEFDKLSELLLGKREMIKGILIDLGLTLCCVGNMKKRT